MVQKFDRAFTYNLRHKAMNCDFESEDYELVCDI